MVLIEFFQCTAEPNRVDKSRYLTRLPNYSVQGLIKEECSVLSPIVEVQYDAGPFLANYARIDEFGRDYFVKNIVCVRQNYWRVYLEVDVLSSYGKYVIEDIPCVIDRNEYEYNPYLKDNCIPFTENVKLKSYKVKNFLNFDINGDGNDFCYVIKIISNANGIAPPLIGGGGRFSIDQPHLGNPYAIGGERTYVMPLKSFNVRYNGSNVIDIYGAENLKAAISVSEQYQSYVISITQFPFDLLSAAGMNMQWNNDNTILSITDSDNQVSFERINVGGQNLDFYGFRLLPKFKQFFYEQFSISDLMLNNNFKDFEPYTRRQLYLPYYGSYTINIKDLYPFKDYQYLRIYYIYEPDSGQTLIVLTMSGTVKDNVILDTLNVTIGSPVDINTTTADKVNRQKLVNQTNYAIEQQRADTSYYVSLINGGSQLAQGVSTVIGTGNILAGVNRAIGAAATTAGASIEYSSAYNIAELNKYAADVVNIPYGIKAAKSLSVTNGFYINQKYLALYIYENEVINDNDELRYHSYGRSLNAARQNLIGTYGFTILMDFHLERLSPHITTTELETLSSILKSGVLLPNKPR